MNLTEKILYGAIVAESIYTSEYVDNCNWGDNSSALLLTTDSLKEKKEIDKLDIIHKLIEWLENGKYSSERLVKPDFTTVETIIVYREKEKLIPSLDGASAENVIGRLLALLPFLKDKTFLERKQMITDCVEVTQSNSLSLICAVVLMELLFKSVEVKEKGEELYQVNVIDNSKIKSIEEKEKIFDRHALLEETRGKVDLSKTEDILQNVERALKIVASRANETETEIYYNVDFVKDIVEYVDENEIYGDSNDFLNRTFLNDINLITTMMCLNINETQLSLNDRIDNVITNALWYSTRKNTYEECVDLAITDRKSPATVFLTGCFSALFHDFDENHVNKLLNKKYLQDILNN